jgi:hypothetical protein
MFDIDYDPPELKEAAYRLAEETPKLGGHPTTPPIRWREDAGLLRVLLADGRTVRGPLPKNILIENDRIAMGLKPPKANKVEAPKLMELSPRVLEPGVPPANLKANGKRSPAKHKAGS